MKTCITPVPPSLRRGLVCMPNTFVAEGAAEVTPSTQIMGLPDPNGPSQFSTAIIAGGTAVMDYSPIAKSAIDFAGVTIGWGIPDTTGLGLITVGVVGTTLDGIEQTFAIRIQPKTHRGKVGFFFYATTANGIVASPVATRGEVLTTAPAATIPQGIDCNVYGANDIEIYLEWMGNDSFVLAAALESALSYSQIPYSAPAFSAEPPQYVALPRRGVREVVKGEVRQAYAIQTVPTTTKLLR